MRIALVIIILQFCVSLKLEHATGIAEHVILGIMFAINMIFEFNLS